MLAPVRSGQFKRDIKRVSKRGNDMQKLRAVVALLLTDENLPAGLNDHPLRGVWKGYRDLHIEPDWLLIYKRDDQEVFLARTGTHSDIFRD